MPYTYHGITTQYCFHVKRDGKSERLNFGSISKIKKVGTVTMIGVEHTELGMAMIAGQPDIFTITMPTTDANRLLDDFAKWKEEHQARIEPDAEDS